MDAVSELLSKFPNAKIVSQVYNLDTDTFIKQKDKIENKHSVGGAIGVIWLNSKKIVLTERTVLYPGWALLGGTVETDETFDETFIREALEESGLDISILRLVQLEKNTYLSPDGNSLIMYIAVFEAKAKLGQSIKSTKDAIREGLKVESFDINNLPKEMILNDRTKILEIINSSDYRYA